MPAWTVSINGTLRKCKTFEINKKVRMDSSPEFTATIEYSDDVVFNNIVTFLRDGVVEWKGFVEDLEISWDESGRYLNLGGRDMTLLLWRKYVENFNNPIPDTGGFFGTVSASELIKFLLRTPRSDLPVVADDTAPNDVSIYPYNKEGWGLDISRFLGLEAKNTGYGDINSVILRKRGLLWSNSGSPFASSDPTTGEGVVDGVVSCTWETHGSSPYINVNDGNSPLNYIKSHTGVNDTAVFTFADLNGGDNATAINNCTLIIKYKPDSTYWFWINSNCQVEIWVNSQSSWTTIGNFGGRNGDYQTIDYDISNILKTVADINAARIRFTELSGDLSTFIQYAYLSVGYVSGGNVSTDDWVNISIQPETIMGIYVECREHADSFPRNYDITTKGALEIFDGYSETDPNNHISLSSDKATLTFDSYQDETAYFVKDYGAGHFGDFDESFSFEVDTSQPHPYAYIPFCIANNLENYYTLYNTAGHYFTAIEVNNTNNVLVIKARLKDSGGNGTVDSYPITLTTRYFVRVTRVGTALRYRIYNNSLMRDSDLILESDGVTPFDETFTTDATTYQYRYQAITYNHAEWSQIYVNNMDYGASGGEQVINGDFETGVLSPWINENNASVVTTSPHSGTYCLEINPLGGIRQEGFDIPKSLVQSATLWHKTTSSEVFQIILHYTDCIHTTSIPVTGTGAWTQFDFLPYWDASKNLMWLEITWWNMDALYLDDISIFEYQGEWSRAGGTGGGTATRSDDAVHQIEGAGCQKIHGNANAQGYYFEEDITATDLIKIDGYVRIPAPASESVNNDLECLTYTSTGAHYHWGVVGTPPYVNNEGNMDANHVWVAGTIPTPAEIDDYFTFQQIDTVTGKVHGSFAPNSNAKLHIEARIYNTGGGNCTNATVRLYIWVQHENGGAGQWHDVTDIGFSASGNAWGTIYDSDVSAILLTKTDWDFAKVRFDIESVTGTDLGESEVQIGYIRFHAEGTGYMGDIRLMKVYNNAIAGGPNPVSGWVAGVLCQLDPSSLTDIDKFRFACDGFSGSGTWNNSATTLEAVVADTWYKLRLYAYKASSGGYFKLYKVVGVSETLLCQVTGIDNHNYGSMDRYEFEIEYGTYNGNGQDAYLDWTTIYTEGPSHSTGIVYAGYGPDVVLVSVTGNTYPDIIHSWSPQELSNIKIVNTDNNATHGWEITQIYVYKTDPVKYRVVLDSVATPTEVKLTFDPSGYVPCLDTDVGLTVVASSSGTLGPLLSFDNDLLEWRVSSSIVPAFGENITITNGTGAGTLTVVGESVWAGGPYITIGSELTPSFEYSAPIGPLNIPKNRLFDALWDICVYVNDEYMPYEWWVDYDTDNTFHIGSRRGMDKSSTVSFVTGVNLEGTKYKKSSRDTYQRCQVIGGSEGKAQDDSSSFWQNDEDAMDEIRGFFEDIVTQKQIANSRLANRYAKVKLKLDASPKRKNGITCVVSKDTYASFDYTVPTDPDTYNVGDDVTITDILAEIDDSFRIYNIKVTWDSNGEQVTLTVQAPYLDMGNVWKQIWKELKNLGIVGTVAQDWAGDGANANKVSADKVSTLFTVTAKNSDIEAQDGSSADPPSTSPQWWQSSPTNNAGWKSDNSNLSIWGGDSGGLGEMIVEAKYAPQTNPDGTPINETVDIPMSQEPKFTCSLKIWEPTGTNYAFWAIGDYVDFGLYNHDLDIGFKFRVVCIAAGEFRIYALYFSSSSDATLTLAELINQGKARLISSLAPNHKYKVELFVEYNSAVPIVTFNVYDEEVDNPFAISAVFTKFNSPSIADSSWASTTVRPIYIHASGTGASHTRCQMNFYEVKCQRDVI